MSKNILNKNISNFSKKNQKQSLDGVYETDIEQLSSFIFISKNETLKVVLKHCGCGIKCESIISFITKEKALGIIPFLPLHENGGRKNFQLWLLSRCDRKK